MREKSLLTCQIKYNNPLRKSMKWYRKLNFEFLLNTAVVNLHIKNNKPKDVYHNISQINWLRHLRRRRTNRHTYNLNKITWKKRKAMRIKLVRRYCIECYNTNSQIRLGSKMAKNLMQKVTIFCNQYKINKPHLFLSCFNKLY